MPETPNRITRLYLQVELTSITETCPETIATTEGLREQILQAVRDARIDAVLLPEGRLLAARVAEISASFHYPDGSGPA